MQIRLSLIRTMLLAVVCLAAACCSGTPSTSLSGSEGPVVIYPDYKDVTIPVNIAPLNYHYAMAGASSAVTTFSLDGRTIRFRGLKVEWKLRKWKSFIAEAAGKTITVSVDIKVEGRNVSDSWSISVIADKIDPYLTYRLIEPTYQTWSNVSIRERNIENFDELTINDYRYTENSCMNCHIHGNSPENLSMYYVRGPKGGAVLNRDGMLRKLNLRAEGMLSGAVYGELHPSGRYGVFSTNVIIPGIHAMAGGRSEVFDTASDLTVADFDSNTMINQPHTSRADRFETFPCFSADGSEVFYCVADTVHVPGDLGNLLYSLVKVSFDAGTGKLGEKVDTLWNARDHGTSICHPKASPDGRWIMFTVSDYGTFPVNHDESALQMIDLHTGAVHDLASIKGNHSDTFHSWSSDGRWFVFASKRGDGQFSKAYYCHLDEYGNPSKPFVLPQKSSRFYINNLKSFNVPDIGRVSTGMKAGKEAKTLYEAVAEKFAVMNY